MKKYEHIGNGATLVSDGDLKYVQFDCFEKYSDCLIHCMSTRAGGVSTGECFSLNLGYNRNDAGENVSENFRRICDTVGIDCRSLVFSNQIHDTRIRIVSEDDKGKGFCRESDIIGYDGLVTDRRGVTLVTFYADCVPLFFYESEKKVAALVHSGWKGTLENIAGEAVKKMAADFYCRKDKIIAAIGPSINKCCFEVGSDVHERFAHKYNDAGFFQYIGDDKCKLDLQGIISAELVKSGLLPENINRSGICTKCNSSLFFSHRGDSGRTGSLAAFMQLR